MAHMYKYWSRMRVTYFVCCTSVSAALVTQIWTRLSDRDPAVPRSDLSCVYTKMSPQCTAQTGHTTQEEYPGYKLNCQPDPRRAAH